MPKRLTPGTMPSEQPPGPGLSPGETDTHLSAHQVAVLRTFMDQGLWHIAMPVHAGPRTWHGWEYLEPSNETRRSYSVHQYVGPAPFVGDPLQLNAVYQWRVACYPGHDEPLDQVAAASTDGDMVIYERDTGHDVTLEVRRQVHHQGLLWRLFGPRREIDTWPWSSLTPLTRPR